MAEAMKVEEVQAAWNDHVRHVEEERAAWRLHRAMNRNKFWQEGRPWGMDAMEATRRFPFLVESNKFSPWISAMVASMFLRRPRSAVTLPAVQASKPGRKASTQDLGDAIRGFIDDCLSRTDVQEQAKRAYTLALMYEASGFRLGFHDRDDDTDDGEKKAKNYADRPDVIDRIWIEAIPRWEMVLDRFASPGEERFRGHVRYRSIDDALEMFGESANLRPVAMADFLETGISGVVPVDAYGSERGFSGYVLILEWYDLCAGTQSFYAVEGSGRSLRQIGTTEAMPWTHADGCPACPLIPAVLLSDPEYPLNGIAAAARVAGINAEKNLGGTIVVNAARRDAARNLLVTKGYLEPEAYNRLAAGRDLELIEVAEKQTGRGLDLANNLAPFPAPPISSSVPALMETMERFWRDAQGTSDNAQGRQGKYLSAQEAQLLAVYGERASTEIQSVMLRTLVQVARMFLTILRTAMVDEGVEKLQLRVQGKPVTLTLAALQQPWEIAIADSASTPIGDQARKEEWSKIAPQMMELARLAFGVQDPQQPPVPPAVQIVARETYRALHVLHGLPESMSLDAIRSEIESATKEAQRLEAAAAKAQDLLGAAPTNGLPPAMPGAAPPPPPVDAAPGGMEIA